MCPDSGTLAWEPWEEGGREAHTTSGVTLGPAACDTSLGQRKRVGRDSSFLLQSDYSLSVLADPLLWVVFCFVLLFFVDFFFYVKELKSTAPMNKYNS